MNSEYPKLATSEMRQVTVIIPGELAAEIDNRVKRTPGLTKQAFWHAAIAYQTLAWHSMEILLPDGSLKVAGAKFAEGGATPRGRPLQSQSADRGETVEVLFRIPPDLKRDWASAIFWQVDVVNLSYAAEDAARIHLARLPTS